MEERQLFVKMAQEGATAKRFKRIFKIDDKELNFNLSIIGFHILYIETAQKIKELRCKFKDANIDDKLTINAEIMSLRRELRRKYMEIAE